MFVLEVLEEDVVVEVLVLDGLIVVWDFFNLISSLAHHSERLIIVTQGKSRLLAIEKLNIIISVNKLNIQIFFVIFIPELQKIKQLIYKIFHQKCKHMKYKIL